MAECFVQAVVYPDCFSRRMLVVVVHVVLAGGLWISNVPSGGAESLDSLMSDISSNGYGLEALATQGGVGFDSSFSPTSSGGTGNHHASGGRSVLDSLGGNGNDSSNSFGGDAARKTLRAENRKLKVRVEDLTAQLAEITQKNAGVQQQLDEQKKKWDDALAALTAEKTKLEKAVSDGVSMRQQMEGVQGQLTESKAMVMSSAVKLADSQSKLAIVTGKLTAVDAEKTQLTRTLTEVREQLKIAISPGAQVPLDTPKRQQAYVVGQAMAASLRERLTGYSNTGVKLDRSRIIAGLADGLRDRMRMKPQDMDKAWQQFAGDLQQQIDLRVKDSEALVKKLIAGRKPAVSADGMQFLLVKKGTPLKDKEAPRSLSLTEQLAPAGQVISEVQRLTLGPDDDMPAVVRDALPLLGPGAQVEVYSLARTVYGDRPLPKGVVPYTVLHYRMNGLGAK